VSSICLTSRPYLSTPSFSLPTLCQQLLSKFDQSFKFPVHNSCDVLESRKCIFTLINFVFYNLVWNYLGYKKHCSVTLNKGRYISKHKSNKMHLNCLLFIISFNYHLMDVKMGPIGSCVVCLVCRYVSNNRSSVYYQYIIVDSQQ
jgi:hypothetical protein